MTIPYNATQKGIVDKLEEGFSEYYYIVERIFNMLESGQISLQEAIKLSEKEKETNNKNKTKKFDPEVKDNLQNSLETYTKTKKLDENKNVSFLHIHIPNAEILKDDLDKELYLTSKDLFKLAAIIKGTVLSIIPPFEELNKYFEDILKILQIYNSPIF